MFEQEGAANQALLGCDLPALGSALGLQQKDIHGFDNHLDLVSILDPELPERF